LQANKHNHINFSPFGLVWLFTSIQQAC
jgi:hypothetical protein